MVFTTIINRLTIEQVGDGWVKYIVSTQPDQAEYSGSTAPPNIPHYFDSFGRFYFHFGSEAGGPEPPRPFTIWIDEIKFYYDDGSIGGQIHVGGQDDAGFDGEFIPDSSGAGDTISPADVTSFSATPGAGQVALSWTNPSDTDFAGVMLRYRTDGTYPANHTKGIAVPNGNDGKIAGAPRVPGSYLHTALNPGLIYYYSAFSYDTSGNYSEADHARPPRCLSTRRLSSTVLPEFSRILRTLGSR
jgi:hypothetical protein